MADAKTGLDRPIFDHGNSAMGEPWWVNSGNERHLLDPNGMVEKLDDVVASADFRDTLVVLNAFTRMETELRHVAAPAYAQDMLDGRRQNINNYDGLADTLGYSPELDRPIGFMVRCKTVNTIMPI